jgi:hypothetical protein
MTIQEKIKEKKLQLAAKQKEINTLRAELNNLLIDDQVEKLNAPVAA